MSAPFEFLPVLEGERLRLRPAVPDDLEALFAAAADPLIWAVHPDPERYRREVFERNFFNPAMTGTGALIVVDRVSDEVIGSSRYYDWNPAAAEVAIGYTFLARSHWGGVTNRELKGLMLAHAFRFARRVWFHIGVDNVRSRKAMEKIGGVLSHLEARDQNGRLVENCYYRIDRDILPANLAGGRQ